MVIINLVPCNTRIVVTGFVIFSFPSRMLYDDGQEIPPQVLTKYCIRLASGIWILTFISTDQK